MHLKNFAVLYTEEGVSLSPAYDLLNVNLVNPQYDEELALTLNGKNKGIRLSDFDALANSMNIPETAVRNTCHKFSSCNKQVGEMINASFLSSEKRDYTWKFGIKSNDCFIDKRSNTGIGRVPYTERS